MWEKRSFRNAASAWRGHARRPPHAVVKAAAAAQKGAARRELPEERRERLARVDVCVRTCVCVLRTMEAGEFHSFPELRRGNFRGPGILLILNYGQKFFPILPSADDFLRFRLNFNGENGRRRSGILPAAAFKLGRDYLNCVSPGTSRF